MSKYILITKKMIRHSQGQCFIWSSVQSLWNGSNIKMWHSCRIPIITTPTLFNPMPEQLLMVMTKKQQTVLLMLCCIGNIYQPILNHQKSLCFNIFAFIFHMSYNFWTTKSIICVIVTIKFLERITTIGIAPWNWQSGKWYIQILRTMTPWIIYLIYNATNLTISSI